MHSIHMPNKMRFLRKSQSAGSALERLFFEVDRPMMTPHVTMCGEGLATINTWKLLLTKVHCAVVRRHVDLLIEHLATGRVLTRNPTCCRALLEPQLIDTNSRCTWIPHLATPWFVDIKKVLGGKGSVTGAARNSHCRVVLRSGVGVVGALVNAQLSSILWPIVYKNLLVPQDVLGSPVVNIALILAAHQAEVSLLGWVVCLGKLV